LNEKINVISHVYKGNLRGRLRVRLGFNLADDREFAERIFKQIEGFGEYGFPESHAASFALLVYVSAWIKRHEPAAFLAALLNSQPMGFYSPSQLVQDGRRHQLEVRPPDIAISEWDCALEEFPEGGQPAVRLGLRLVKGLSAAAADRIAEVRAIKPFASVDDLARRAELSTQDLQALAKANALLSLSGHRRQAAWQVAGMRIDMTAATKLLKDAPIAEDGIALPSASEGQEIIADYSSLGLTLNRHPLALLRDRFKAMNLSTAREMKSFPNRKLARTTGLVTMR
jgi:error-prone DNA polymerase